MIDDFLSLFKVIHFKEQNFVLVDHKFYKKWKIIVKLILFFNKNYKSCEIYRKNWRYYNNFVVVGLKYNGKKVKRRCGGNAKSYVIRSQNPKCIYCQIPLNRLNATTDHIVPISEGGNNCKVNLIVVCSKCNNERGNLEFYRFFKLKNPHIKGKTFI